MSGRRQPQLPPPSPTPGWVVLLSIVAIVVSLGAVAFTVIRGGGASDSCRTLAWDALPNGSGLPVGWTVTAGNFYADGAGNSLVGPETVDGAAPETLYLQVTCYGADSHLAMTRSHQSALAAGSTDAKDVATLGEESFATEDPTNGSTSIYVRRGGLVAVLVVPSTLDPDDLDQVAEAVDDGLASAGSTASRPVPTARPPGASPTGAVDSPTAEASASDEPVATPMHGALELEALLPKVVGGVALTRQSTTGMTAIGSDPAIQEALTTFLAKLGKTLADLQSAEAYDETAVSDIGIFAYRVTGIAGPALGQAIIDSDSIAVGSGVTTTKETVGGKAVTHIRYGEISGDDYVYVKGDVVFDVTTSDPATAIQALTALP